MLVLLFRLLLLLVCVALSPPSLNLRRLPWCVCFMLLPLFVFVFARLVFVSCLGVVLRVFASCFLRCFVVLFCSLLLFCMCFYVWSIFVFVFALLCCRVLLALCVLSVCCVLPLCCCLHLHFVVPFTLLPVFAGSPCVEFVLSFMCHLSVFRSACYFQCFCVALICFLFVLAVVDVVENTCFQTSCLYSLFFLLLQVGTHDCHLSCSGCQSFDASFLPELLVVCSALFLFSVYVSFVWLFVVCLFCVCLFVIACFGCLFVCCTFLFLLLSVFP